MRNAAPDAMSVETDEPLMKLTVRFADGRRFRPDAAPGFRIMELIRAFGLPIKAECGGVGVCATCHVRIAPEWQDRVPPPSADELGKLDEIPDADDSSRLCCQIEMTDDLDGMELELHSDSIALKSSFLAG